jgi:zinc/manganese transport system ATP-binding protein/zinc transport system ATP-binding protein
MTTHDLNAAAAHVPWVICLNRTVIAEGQPEAVFTEETLNRTYQGDMIVVRQDGLLLVHQRPHPHTHRELLPDPVLGHTGDDLGAQTSSSAITPADGDVADCASQSDPKRRAGEDAVGLRSDCASREWAAEGASG